MKTALYIHACSCKGMCKHDKHDIWVATCPSIRRAQHMDDWLLKRPGNWKCIVIGAVGVPRWARWSQWPAAEVVRSALSEEGWACPRMLAQKLMLAWP